MIDLHAVLTVLSVYAVGVVIPGPNFVAVAHKAASTTTREALAMVAGIVVVNLFWASCSILGVGIVFATFPWIALAVKVTGAAYLIWFGGRLVWKAGSSSAAVTPLTRGSWLQSFRSGVTTNIANPKSMAFYAAVFAAAAPKHVSAPTFLAMLGTVALVASVWYGLVSVVFATPSVAVRYRRSKAWIDRVCGSIIVGLGIRQLVR